jgi:DNA-binding CsgD family transcriptional regulator
LLHWVVVIKNTGVVGMLLTETGFELVEHLDRQKDVPSLLASFQRLVEAFGLCGFCIGDPSHQKVKRVNRRWDGNWPIAWEMHYASQDYLSVDPLVEQMNRAPCAFRWSSLFARVDPVRRRVLDDAAAFGIRDGFAVPIHGPRGAIGAVAISATHYDLAPQDEHALRMASLYLHAQMNVLRGDATVHPIRNLTPRERECLNWVAAGKTDWEISQILNISEQTTHGYVQNAMTKLGARTRAQAVALAIQSSQIQP